MVNWCVAWPYPCVEHWTVFRISLSAFILFLSRGEGKNSFLEWTEGMLLLCIPDRDGLGRIPGELIPELCSLQAAKSCPGSQSAIISVASFQCIISYSREKSKNTTTIAWGLVSQHTESGGDLQITSTWYPVCQGFLPLFYFRFGLNDTTRGISRGQSQPVGSKEALANVVTEPARWIPLC